MKTDLLCGVKQQAVDGLDGKVNSLSNDIPALQEHLSTALFEDDQKRISKMALWDQLDLVDHTGCVHLAEA